MPFYPFKCDDCVEAFEEFQKLKETHKGYCPKCGKEGKRVWTPVNFALDFKYGFDVGAGKYFDSNRQRNNYITEQGLRRVKA